MQKVQRGNVLLIVLVFAVLALGAGGYYFYSKSTVKGNLIPKALNQNRDVTGSENNSSTPPPAESGNTINEKMFLTITSPRNGDSLNSRGVTVIGKTVANADVFVNDQQTKADANGNFSYSLTMDEGANEILVTANDSEGNAVEQDLSVNVQTF